VFLEGKLVAACQVNWASVVDGSSLETYEDLSKEPAAQAAVQRFQKLRPTRCMLCVPGLAITAVDLCRRGRAGDEEAIEDSLQSTSCACTGRGSLRRSLLAGRG
jgi:carbon-monoxide dehydrogenase small subunit